MARPRKIRDKYNIPYVHIAHGRIVYRPYLPADQREGVAVDKRGFLSPAIVLGKPGDDADSIYRAYTAARESLALQKASARNTLGWIVDQYLHSRQFASLAPNTQKAAPNLARILQHPLRINGQDRTLADLHIRQLTQPLLHQVAERRLSEFQARGKKGTVQVNRETTFVSTAIAWACNFIHDLGVASNPLRGYQKYREQGRERYVTDAEYQIQMQESAKLRPWLPVLFELAYLLACRGAEVLGIRLSDCTESGVVVRRLKGSRDNMILWSPRLRQAYHDALALHDKAAQTVRDPWLLCKANGEGITVSALHTYMQRLNKQMAAAGMSEVYWNLHALKHKGISDSDDKKIAGHKSEAMRQRYDQSLSEHNPVK